jgi:hypothetical protein
VSYSFVQVPTWIDFAKLSDKGLKAYVCLGKRGTFRQITGTYDECRPKVKTLAADMGCSESSAQRAVNELVDLGYASKELRFNADGSPAPSVYQLHVGRLMPPEGVEGAKIS